ncbi:MAG: hypothetical protein KY393_08265 [Actinobacteria bacterium]|nr:hypothetical protein [Actinomycetota bacterium]
MRHLSEGSLRWMLDDPLSLADEDRAHLRKCRRCREAAARVIGDARRAAAVFETDHPALADPAAVLRALRERGVI